MYGLIIWMIISTRYRASKSLKVSLPFHKASPKRGALCNRKLQVFRRRPAAKPSEFFAELIPFIMTVSVNILYHRRDFVSMGPLPLDKWGGMAYNRTRKKAGTARDVHRELGSQLSLR